jgi:hypothetical protein
MRALALGGAMVAGELWIPGRTFISLPPPRLLKYKATERFSPGWTEDEDELKRVVAKFLLQDSEVIRYKNLWIAASRDGALMSRNGYEWEAIHPTEMYRNGDRVVSVTHALLEECSA